MSKHEIKTCQRCRSHFECKMGDISNCQCSTVVLEEPTSEYLSKTNYDCLCKNCLAELNKLVRRSNEQEFPKRREFLLEGHHYYMENGFFVFTELYHILRGNCCGSGCRHCAYGYNLKPPDV